MSSALELHARHGRGHTVFLATYAEEERYTGLASFDA